MVEYVKEGKIIAVTGCKSDETEIEIPEFIEDLPVAKIKENAFSEMTKLEKVKFPKNLKLISSYAFAGCKKLKEVVFQEGLERIEDWAFISTNLENVNLPNSLKFIGENAFLGTLAKFKIDESIKKKQELKKLKQRVTTKNNATIFPVELLLNMEDITLEIIKERANYHSSELEDVEEGKMQYRMLDLPFLFDQDEWMIAIYTKMPLSNVTITLDKDSKGKIGLYEDDDPDFLVLKATIYQDKEAVGDVAFKCPYLENISFEVSDVYSVENNGYISFIRFTVKMDNYGSANIDREYAFDYFKELEGKYLTQLKNNLIDQSTYDSLKNEISQVASDAIKSFLKQVSGAPILNYILEIIDLLQKHDDFNINDELDTFVQTQLLKIYNTLGDYKSFENICFDLKPLTKFITEHLGSNLEEINQKYNIFIKDDEGNQLSIEDIALYRTTFVDNDYNLTLHAEYMNYIFQVMNKLEREYCIKTFQG